MTEETLRVLLKAHRWTMKRKPIGKRGRVYYYAVKRGFKDIYLCRESELAQMVEDTIVARLL